MRRITLWNTPDDSYEVDCRCNFDNGSFIDGDNNRLICQECGYEKPIHEANTGDIRDCYKTQEERSVNQ